jgi:hypothetical protein
VIIRQQPGLGRGDQIVTALELDVDLGPRLLGPVAALDKVVVSAPEPEEQQHYDDDHDDQNNHWAAGSALRTICREIEVIRRRLELARENGVPESTLQPLLQQLVGRPLEALGTLQDRGVIDGSSAEIRELEPGEDPEPA